MNCCDEYGNCRQGRDCPARVAKVGQRMPDAEPLPPSTWHSHLRHLSVWMLVVIWMLLCAAAFVAGVMS